ncbi:MAG: hypothetical protein ACYDH6_09585 [Acidimicrobiales bacterium]
MIYGGTGYKVLLILHLLSAIVAFGPWFLNGLLPSTALKRGQAEGQAINSANFTVSTFTQYAMYAVLVFGFATLGAKSKDAPIKMSQAWVVLAILAWVAIVGVLHSMVLPAQRALKDDTGDRETLTRRQSLGVAVINLLVIFALYLMVFAPGL